MWTDASIIDQSITIERIMATLGGMFGALALLVAVLTGVGISIGCGGALLLTGLAAQLSIRVDGDRSRGLSRRRLRARDRRSGRRLAAGATRCARRSARGAPSRVIVVRDAWLRETRCGTTACSRRRAL